MELWVNGVSQTTMTVDNPDWVEYVVLVVLTGQDQIDVVFANDYYVLNVEDRNLYVDFVQVGTTLVQAEGATVYDIGFAIDAFGGANVQARQEFVHLAGSLRFVLGTGSTTLGHNANGNLNTHTGKRLVWVWRTGCKWCNRMEPLKHCLSMKKGGALL